MCGNFSYYIYDVVNQLDAQGNSLLQWAAKYNRVTVIGLLLDQGANILANGGGFGENALFWAIRSKNFSSIHCLIKRSRRVNADGAFEDHGNFFELLELRNKAGLNALQLAYQLGTFLVGLV